ncbi:MAG: poly[(R)-3-hydroxyalkanoate] polymerase subunit PhaC [Actinomycetota bacterium]|nr:poly[(R)-3-hydroxyalkanoate] polymerase subunit PhaC [Actinomycetota bacterium]
MATTPQTEGNGNGRGRANGRTKAAVIDPPAEETRERRGSAAEQAAAQAAEILAPESGLGTLDPVSFGKALGRFGTEVARRPLPTIAAMARYGTGLSLTGLAAAGRSVGLKTPGPIAPPAKDKRFADRAWEDNAAFFATGQAYRLMGRLVDDLLALAELEEPWNGKAGFAMRALVDAFAPTNFLATNPAALKRAFETGGVSLLRGARNFMTDVATNGGFPRKVDRSAFTVGKNIAATPGKVVFRNDLMELIQYEPQTPTTYSIPLLSSPPWINKYYIMDLAPGRSFVEWAVQHGHTVFQISYRNADESMGKVRLDDYLLEGPRTAIDVINEITGSEKVNMVGLCLGGSLTGMLLAYMAAKGDNRINSATLLNTMLDFSDAGGLGNFTDPESVTRLEAKMAKRGYLDSNEMSRTFDLMRANDLIWNYVASNWLMGEAPPAFDILAWNEDGTRMPAAMHSFYLRSCYIGNQLARGAMTLADTPLDLSAIKADTYVLSAKEDHIALWTTAYKTTQLLSGHVRYTLSSSGHIAGIVNPPSPKAMYWTNPENPADPKAWLNGATEHKGSWWEDWTAWIAERSGAKRDAPAVGSAAYPPVDDAPGKYVLG